MSLHHYYHHLHSERLSFRQLTKDDVESWMDFYENNPNLEYLGIDLNRSNHAMATAWVDAQLLRYRKQEFGQLAMVSKTTGELIGTKGFNWTEYNGRKYLEAMCSVKPAYWRQGFGLEAALSLYDFIFQHKVTDTILSTCHVSNQASQAHLVKLGFVKQEDLTLSDRTVSILLLNQQGWENNALKRAL